ncbi:MAG: ATP synthase F1 subunit epsilon [Bacteroidetes bacterium]|nr:ATP synthase F1 subunit epsilon [Bacteroidota bacterium]
MQIEILTPEETLFAGEVTSLKLPGAKGEFQVLNNHAPIISTLTKGTVVCTTKEGEKRFEITSGVAEVMNNKVIVLV